MGVEMAPDEVQTFLQEQHTGILVTQETDGPGMPVPVWFWATEGHVYVSSPPGAAKVRRIHESPRVNFLVEDGLAWADLRAVVVEGRATVHESGPVHERAITELNERYAAFRVAPELLPSATTRRYDNRVIIDIEVVRVRVSWDNSKVRRQAGG